MKLSIIISTTTLLSILFFFTLIDVRQLLLESLDHLVNSLAQSLTACRLTQLRRIGSSIRECLKQRMNKESCLPFL